MKLSLRKEFYDKYVDTHVLLREHAGDEPLLVLITGSYYEEENVPLLSESLTFRVRGHVYDEQKREWGVGHFIDLNEYIIDLSMPSFGYRNGKSGHAVYISQEPVRQWKRGLSTRQLLFDATELPPYEIQDQFDIGALYFPIYPPLKVAVEDVAEGRCASVAVHEDYVVGSMYPSKAVYVYYKTYPVGVVYKHDSTGEYYALLPKTNEYFVEDLEQHMPCEVKE